MRYIGEPLLFDEKNPFIRYVFFFHTGEIISYTIQQTDSVEMYGEQYGLFFAKTTGASTTYSFSSREYFNGYEYKNRNNIWKSLRQEITNITSEEQYIGDSTSLNNFSSYWVYVIETNLRGYYQIKYTDDISPQFTAKLRMISPPIIDPTLPKYGKDTTNIYSLETYNYDKDW
jgi:hypothetical protein